MTTSSDKFGRCTSAGHGNRLLYVNCHTDLGHLACEVKLVHGWFNLWFDGLENRNRERNSFVSTISKYIKLYCTKSQKFTNAINRYQFKNPMSTAPLPFHSILLFAILLRWRATARGKTVTKSDTHLIESFFIHTCSTSFQ